jgi:tRNA(fMet)-specific endonuclease VapC
MKFLLDTNAWIKALNPQPSAVKQKIANGNPTDIVMCSVVKAELYFGAYKSTQQTANLQLLNKLFSQFESLNFTDEDAEICGRIRTQLAKSGTPIGPYDLQIASIALTNNLVLVTHNTKEFARIIGLQIEDWE